MELPFTHLQMSKFNQKYFLRLLFCHVTAYATHAFQDNNSTSAFSFVSMLINLCTYLIISL